MHPSAEAAVSIAKALGVTVEYLVTGSSPEKGILVSSLPEDIQEITLTARQLNQRDRLILLTLARFLKNK